MSDNNGHDRTKEIERLIEAYYKGEGKAITRKDLLPKLQDYIPELDDRDMRKAYETLCLCWCNTGIYAPATEEERWRQIEKLKGLIRGYAAEIKRLKQYEIKPMSQMRLFDGGMR